ncbi:MAG: hypothetical protein WC521_00410 [Bdellovibrionales bacterium]
MDKNKYTSEEFKEAADLCVDLAMALLDESLATEYFADNMPEMRKKTFTDEAARLVKKAYAHMHEYEKILGNRDAELCKTAIELYPKYIEMSEQNTASTKRCTLNTRPSA